MTNNAGYARRPAEIERSQRLWWAAMVGVVIGGVMGVIEPRQSALSVLQPHVNTAAMITAGRVTTVVVLVAELVVWLLLVHYTVRGSNTARIWLTVLAWISVAFSLFSAIGQFLAPSGLNVIAGLLQLAVIVVAVLAIVAMHRPSVGGYFHRRT